MALLSPQQASVTGLDTVYSVVTASDTFVPHARGVLHYRTAGTGSTNVIVLPGNNDVSQANPDITVTMAATDDKHIKTGPLVKYADPATRLLTVTTSSQVSHTVAYIIV